MRKYPHFDLFIYLERGDLDLTILKTCFRDSITVDQVGQLYGRTFGPIP